MKEFLLYFVIQALNYSLLTINFRAVAQGNIPLSLLSDFFNATFSFFIIRHIAKSDDSLVGWAGFVTGSLVGTTLGILAN